jgi:hypothetical protein
MADLQLRPPDIHPEFGYFWPSRRIRRRLRATGIVVAASLVLMLGPLSVFARHAFESGSGETDGRNTVVGAALPQAETASIAPFPYYKPKRRQPESHPYARVFFGIVADAIGAREPRSSRLAPPTASAAVAPAQGIRTVTVYDGSGRRPAQSFVVPVD